MICLVLLMIVSEVYKAGRMQIITAELEWSRNRVKMGSKSEPKIEIKMGLRWN